MCAQLPLIEKKYRRFRFTIGHVDNPSKGTLICLSVSYYFVTSLLHIFVRGVVQEEISRQLDETILNTSSSIFIICLFTEDNISTIM